MDSDKDTEQENSIAKGPTEESPPAPSELSDLADTPIEQIKKPSSNSTRMQPEAASAVYDEANAVEDTQEKSNKKLYIWGGAALSLIVILTIGFFMFSSKEIKEEESPTAQVEATSTPQPTEAPKKVLKREEWSLEVLNGSGVSGLAKKVADKLAALGYPVVKTGNADKDDYKDSLIFTTTDLKDKVELIIADIKDVIKIASFGGELKDSTASARIIIGKDQ